MPTSIKQALKRWEEATGRKAADSKEIKLVGVSPPIEKMEGPFHLLVNLEKLSLSTNMIQNIQNLQSFKSLKILSLGRNALKSLQGVEAASETLEQLWIAYNQIDKLKPLRNLVKLKVNRARRLQKGFKGGGKFSCVHRMTSIMYKAPKIFHDINLSETKALTSVKWGEECSCAFPMISIMA